MECAAVVVAGIDELQKFAAVPALSLIDFDDDVAEFRLHEHTNGASPAPQVRSQKEQRRLPTHSV